MLTTRFLENEDISVDVLFIIPTLSDDFFLKLESEYQDLRKCVIYHNKLGKPSYIVNLNMNIENINIYSLKLEIEKRIQEFIKIRNNNGKKHINISIGIPFIRTQADFFIQEFALLEEKYKTDNIQLIIYSDIGRPELEYSLLKSVLYKMIDGLKN